LRREWQRPVYLRIDPAALDILDRIAFEHRTSRSELIREAVEQFLSDPEPIGETDGRRNRKDRYQYNTYMPQSLIDRVDEYAQKIGAVRAAVLRAAVDKFLRNHRAAPSAPNTT